MDTNAEKRVALAKDVIAQLDAGKITPRRGTYVEIAGKQCRVCALGSLLVACCGPNVNDTLVDEDSIMSCLEEFFDDDQVSIIEAAFEGNSQSPCSDFGEETQKAARAFPKSLSAPKRLRAIMNSIITNNGTFVPEQL